MNIVHIGAGTTGPEIEHITGLRDAGHDYYVPGDSTHEQLVRRIIDADEIHIFDISREFELGMVYFYSVHALHYKVGFLIRLFGDALTGGRDSLTPLFREPEPEPKPSCVVQGPAKFVPPCHSGIGPCNECAQRDYCREQEAKHEDHDHS